MSKYRVTYLLAAMAMLAALIAPSALAASPPTVSTGAALSPIDTAATLTGNVNPNGQATQYAFQYGPTSAYGHESTLTSAGSGSSSEAVSAIVAGLTPGSTYHFRIIALSSAGTSVGSDGTFNTTGTAPAPSTPPSATTGSSSNVTGSSATVSGTVNPGGQATTYAFEYGPTANYGYQTAQGSAGSGSSSVPETASLSGLTPGTTYHYRIVAYNAGNTDVGGDHTFTTPNPPIPVTGAATSISSSEATLSGTVDPNGHTTSYEFQFGTTALLGQITPPAGIGSGSSQVSVHQTVTGLAPNTTYYYRLVGTSTGGGTGYGAVKSFKTAPSTAPVSSARILVNFGFVASNNVTAVGVGCFGGTTTCSGKMTLTVGHTTYSTRNFTLAAGDGGFVHTSITSGGRKALFPHGHQVNIRVNITLNSGQKLTKVLRFALYS